MRLRPYSRRTAMRQGNCFSRVSPERTKRQVAAEVNYPAENKTLGVESRFNQCLTRRTRTRTLNDFRRSALSSLDIHDQIIDIMAGPVRQPIDLASLERYIDSNVPALKTPLQLKQVRTLHLRASLA